jgi:hypothetical protein
VLLMRKSYRTVYKLIPFVTIVFIGFSALSSKVHGAEASEEYDFTIPTQDERKVDKSYSPIEGIGAIHLIDKNLPVPQETRRWIHFKKNSGISLDQLQELRIKDIYIKPADVTVSDNLATIPFIASVRYVETFTVQGTLNVRGTIELFFENSRLKDIQVTRYYDSSWTEYLGRKVGFISKYDLNFAQDVVRPALGDELDHSEQAREFLVKTVLEAQNGQVPPRP